VNKGWLQQYRDNAPERVLKETKAGSGKIKSGRVLTKQTVTRRWTHWPMTPSMA
jgi:hypothetical protein